MAVQEPSELTQVLAVARLRAEGLVSSAEQPIDVAGVGLSQPSEADFNLQELVAWADAELCFEAHGPPGNADVDSKVPHVVCASGSTEQWSGIDANNDSNQLSGATNHAHLLDKDLQKAVIPGSDFEALDLVGGAFGVIKESGAPLAAHAMPALVHGAADGCSAVGPAEDTGGVPLENAQFSRYPSTEEEVHEQHCCLLPDAEHVVLLEADSVADIKLGLIEDEVGARDAFFEAKGCMNPTVSILKVLGCKGKKFASCSPGMLTLKSTFGS